MEDRTKERTIACTLRFAGGGQNQGEAWRYASKINRRGTLWA